MHRCKHLPKVAAFPAVHKIRPRLSQDISHLRLPVQSVRHVPHRVHPAAPGQLGGTLSAQQISIRVSILESLKPRSILEITPGLTPIFSASSRCVMPFRRRRSPNRIPNTRFSGVILKISKEESPPQMRRAFFFYSPWCRRAAVSRFSISMARVMGPTPPGTGVM